MRFDSRGLELTAIYFEGKISEQSCHTVFAMPSAAFYRYLQGIVDAGFANRIMFGSDAMVWPGVIERSIKVIEEAPLLNEKQKRDILCNNAARFLRLSEEEIARHHGK